MLVGYLEPKFEKKSLKKDISVSRDLEVKGTSQSEENANYCKQLFEKTGEDKQTLFKEIETLKRNRKRATEPPFNLIIKIYDQLSFQKK